MNVPTHRGFVFEGKNIDEVQDIFKVGAKTDMQISSFSTDSAIGRDFARIGKTAEGNTSVVLDLEPGAKGLNISPISNYLSEKERIFHGRFEVVSVEQATWRDNMTGIISPYVNVRIRQIHNFVREAR